MDRWGRLELIRRYGWNTTSFQTLEPHFKYWFDSDGPGMVAYYQTLGTWVAAGAPVAPPERVRECALGFARAANEAGYGACFFGVFQRFVEQMTTTAEAVKIGEQPWWNPQRWDGRSDRRRTIGTQVRRAERLGVEVRQLDPLALEHPDSLPRRAAQSVMDAWQRSHRMATMSFTVFLDPFSFPEQRRYFLAEQRAENQSDGVPVGFLALVPVYARNGWFLEDILRRPGAPNGTAEAMIDCAMRAIAAEGAEYATLGLSPLHGVEQSLQLGPWWMRRAVRLSKRYLNALYSFEGLATFKAKFRPDGWEEIYLVGMSRITPRMLLAVLAAFTRSRPAQFAVSSLRRLTLRWLRRIEPRTWQRISYGFALTLVLWMVLLSRVDSVYWFGTPAMRDTWIAFDCMMVVVFVLLGRGVGKRKPFTPYLALVSCGAALTDSFLTTMQAIHFHVLRGGSYGELAMWLVALSGPLLAGCYLLAVAVGSRGRHGGR
jgi:phosphatidylglycerol lysyltransferase